LIPTKSAYRFHDDLANETLVILKNIGHVPMEEGAKESLEVVKGFLKN
jgi:pimeloyl-ACP methyl ester carboxylesterase